MKKRQFLLFVLMLCFTFEVMAQEIFSEKQLPDFFSIKNAVIYVDANDFSLVKKSAKLLQKDIEMVTGKKIPILNSIPQITAWLKLPKIKSRGNKWESYSIQTVWVNWVANNIIIKTIKHKISQPGQTYFKIPEGKSPRRGVAETGSRFW